MEEELDRFARLFKGFRENGYLTRLRGAAPFAGEEITVDTDFDFSNIRSRSFGIDTGFLRFPSRVYARIAARIMTQIEQIYIVECKSCAELETEY